MFVLALPSRFPLRFLLAVLLGALHAASFVDDATWPLQIAALAGLVALAMRAANEVAGPRGLRRALWGGARVGFGFGLGWFLVGVSWIYISLHRYGEMPAPVAGAAIFAFCAYLAIYPALATALFAGFRHRSSTTPLASIAVFAGAWTLSEFGRGYVFTGFPWLASGYAHVGGPLAGYAPLVGVYGVTLVSAAVAAAVAAVMASGAGRRFQRLASGVPAMVAIIVGLPLAGSALMRIDWTTPIDAPISVRLLQGNVSQDVKFDMTQFEDTSEAYLKSIEARRADLIVLPETAFPVLLSDLPAEIAERLARDALAMKTEIAFGIPIDDGHDRYFNSVIAIGPPTLATPPAASADPKDDDPLLRTSTQRYDKSHLVPFGEFIPLGFHWFVRLMKMPLGDFTRGKVPQQPMTLAGLRVAFNVCYEDLFGEEIIHQLPAANVLVNVSNVAWFGDSMALPQHLDISRMRSIETGRPMLRATNTGMTASIDPHGRVLAVMAPFTAGSLDVAVQGMQGSTPFIRFGNGPAFGFAGLLLIAGFVVARRRRGRVRVDREGIIDAA
jgi:apolipoprotein N-acyltransferase